MHPYTSEQSFTSFISNSNHLNRSRWIDVSELSWPWQDEILVNKLRNRLRSLSCHSSKDITMHRKIQQDLWKLKFKWRFNKNLSIALYLRPSEFSSHWARVWSNQSGWWPSEWDSQTWSGKLMNSRQHHWWHNSRTRNQTIIVEDLPYVTTLPLIDRKHQQ